MNKEQQWVDEVLPEKAAWDGQCLIWLGSRGKNGYANTRFAGTTRYVTRVILAAREGRSVTELRRNEYTLHSCDRGHEGCVTPEHIRLGTPLENSRETVERNRHSESRKTHCPRGHALAEGNLVLGILPRQRKCLICNRARARMQLNPDLTMEESIEAILAKYPELKEKK